MIETTVDVNKTVAIVPVDETLYEYLRPEIRKLAVNMENKFRVYDPIKGNPFKPIIQLELEDSLFRAEEKLIAAMGELKDPGQAPVDVWKHTADVCNLFLMMAVKYQQDYGFEKQCIKDDERII